MPMRWQGEYYFGQAWIAYRGVSAENHLHAHAAVQLIVGSQVRMTDDDSYDDQADGWIVCSGVRHRIEATGLVTILLIDPDAHLARSLTSTSGPKAQIIPMPNDSVEKVRATKELECVADELESPDIQFSGSIDPRLRKALAYVRTVDEKLTLEVVCNAVGISPSRLRALSHEQLGTPFSKIVLWRKVSIACQLLAAGASLSSAAAGSGFADQAHLTRTMKDTIGLTPGQTQTIDTR